MVFPQPCCIPIFCDYFQMFFEDNIDDAKYCGHLYGLGTSYVQNGGSGYEVGPGLLNNSSSTNTLSSTPVNTNAVNSNEESTPVSTS